MSFWFGYAVWLLLKAITIIINTVEVACNKSAYTVTLVNFWLLQKPSDFPNACFSYNNELYRSSSKLSDIVNYFCFPGRFSLAASDFECISLQYDCANHFYESQLAIIAAAFI